MSPTKTTLTAGKHELVKLTTFVHPELRRALKIAAVTEEQTMEEKMHLILCRELDRKDLLFDASQTAPKSRAR